MKVMVFDVDDKTRKPLGGNYLIDTTLGLPAVGDELFLRERDYNEDRFYLEAVVRRRRFVFSDNAPAGAELHLWVQQRPR